MAPSLKAGERILINKSQHVRRNGIVAIKRASGVVLSRVIGLPGDTVTYKEGQLIVNGVERMQKTVSLENQRKTVDFAVATPLSKGSYYVLADQREGKISRGRTAGLVNEQEILGVVAAMISAKRE